MEIFNTYPSETMIHATSRMLFWAAFVVFGIALTRFSLNTPAMLWFEFSKLTFMASFSFWIACFLEIKK